MSYDNLTPAERTVLLKAVSTHIISLRKRVENANAPPDTKADWEYELTLCVSGRNKLEDPQTKETE